MLQARYNACALMASLLISGCGVDHNAELIGQAPGPSASLETDDTILRDLKTIPHVPADGVKGPNGTSFFVHDRTADIGQFPCTTCHEALPESTTVIKPLMPMHRDIKIKHAGADVMNCTTCHDTDSPNDLHLLGGRKVAMNVSYQVCTQCHSQQAKDWAGGAHGKRLAGWKGRRVINSCTDCHNPHAPAMPHKQPEGGPRFALER